MKIICKTEIKENGLLLLYPSKAVKQKMIQAYKLAEEKSAQYMTVEFCRVYKSRTTGLGSQNNKLHFILAEICKATGNDLDDVKDAVKYRAIKRGYPFKENPYTGEVKPVSTTKINTVEMSYLIDEAMQLAAEEGIVIDAEPPKAEPKADEKLYDIF